MEDEGEEQRVLLATVANALVTGLAIDRCLTHDDERVAKSLRLAQQMLESVSGSNGASIVADLTERAAAAAPSA
jgi:hypothetical protein